MTCRKQYDRDQRAEYREKYKMRHAERIAQYKQKSNYSLTPATEPIKKMCDTCGSRYLLCPNCGRKITNPDRNQIFCCRQCVVDNRKKHRQKTTPKIEVPKVEAPKVEPPKSKYKNNLNSTNQHQCVVCHKEFTSQRTNTKVCSPPCRQTLNAHNARAYQAKQRKTKTRSTDNITKNIIGAIKL